MDKIKIGFQILLFIPFALTLLAFAASGRLVKRLRGYDFFAKKVVIGVLNTFALIGGILTGWIGKIYE